MSTSDADSRPVCPYCGHEDLVDGKISGQHRTRFKPTGMSWLKSGAPLRATACVGCGGLWIWVEQEDLARALGRPRW